MRYFLQSVSLALQNIRSNPLHTFLSTLGIIIGVAALVGILALGDGLERAARDQISTTTGLQNFTISAKSRITIDGVSVPVKERPRLALDQVRELQQKYNTRAIVELTDVRTTQAAVGDSLYGVYLNGATEKAIEMQVAPDWMEGRFFTQVEVDSAQRVVVISEDLANRLEPDNSGYSGLKLTIDEQDYEVIGVLKTAQDRPQAVVPITVFDATGRHFPTISIKVNNVEELPVIKEEISGWLDQKFEQGSAAFDLISNEYRVEQLSQGILLFKLVMGAITGISVLVGGIGVMNVLLISVTERTKEIGVRKATGAQKVDIIYQFLAESITISLVGAIAGWIVGMAGVFAFVPLVNKLVEVDFAVVINPASILVILAVAIFIGVSFGTYPAWRAAQLDPIDAIRHE